MNRLLKGLFILYGAKAISTGLFRIVRERGKVLFESFLRFLDGAILMSAAVHLIGQQNPRSCLERHHRHVLPDEG